MPSESNKDDTVVNRYTDAPSDASAHTHTAIKRSIGDAIPRDPDSAAVPGRYRTASIIDPGQFPTSTQPHSSSGDAATTTARQNTGFSAPSPFIGLSLADLTSQHADLNGIAFTPQWRDNAPTAIAKLRRLLPASPPPAYQLLAWACDQFAAFTRSGSCGDSTALMDVLSALHTLIQDAQSQVASSPPPEDTPLPSSKRQRRDSAARTTRADALTEPLLDNTASQLESYRRALEDIPADAKDWTEKANPITKKILAAVQHDERLDPQHHVRDACLVFDMLGSQIVGDDLVHELRQVVRGQLGTTSTAPRERIPDAGPGLPDEALSSSHELTTASSTSGTATRSKITAPTVSMTPAFNNVVEAAVYETLRWNPTMPSTELQRHPGLSGFKPGVITAAASAVRPHIAFGIPTETFLRILHRAANSNCAEGFVRSLAREEKLALDIDLFEDLNRALFMYRLDHDGELPTNEKEAASLATYLPQNTTTAAIWTAAACPNQSCMSREEALVRWKKHGPTSAADRASTLPVASQVGGNGAHGNRPLTVEQAVLQHPWLSNKRLGNLLPMLSPYNIGLGARARDLLAYSLPNVDMVLQVIEIANSANDVKTFLTVLGNADLGMNQYAFPDWKIALQSYKAIHENRIPSSAEDLKDFVKCIQPSKTAAPVYFAMAENGPYCERLDAATRDWRAIEPSKFEPFKNFLLPDSIWP